MTAIPMPSPAPQPRRFSSRWGRRAAGAYLLVVLAAVLFVAWAHVAAQGAPDFAGIWLALVTMPVSALSTVFVMLAFVDGAVAGAVMIAGIVGSVLAGAAVNTWLLYQAGSALERRRRARE